MNQRIAESGGLARSLWSVAVGLMLAGILMRLSGYNPWEAYSALGTGATGLMSGKPVSIHDLGFGAGAWTGHLNRYILAQALARVTPLLYAGLAIALGLRAGLFNIGAYGQMMMGALAAAVVGAMGQGAWPTLLHIPFTLLAGALGGALWGLLAGLLKALRGVHEVISTIMLNYIAFNLIGYLINHGLRDPSPKNLAPQTALVMKTAWLQPLVPGSNLSAGIFLALAAAFGFSLLMRRAALGYEIRATGLGAEAAEAAGISVRGILLKTMALSGALAGLAGAIEVMGVHHRYVPGVAGSYGFDGIAVALLGGLNGGGVTLSALFFGMLANGAEYMKTQTDVPESISLLVQAAVILAIGIRIQRKAAVGKLLAAVTDTDERRFDDAPNA